MNTFLAGILFGFLFAGGIFVIFITHRRRPKRDIIDWTEQAYIPPVTTRILVKERNIQL